MGVKINVKKGRKGGLLEREIMDVKEWMINGREEEIIEMIGKEWKERLESEDKVLVEELVKKVEKLGGIYEGKRNEDGE